MSGGYARCLQSWDAEFVEACGEINWEVGNLGSCPGAWGENFVAPVAGIL